MRSSVGMSSLTSSVGHERCISLHRSIEKDCDVSMYNTDDAVVAHTLVANIKQICVLPDTDTDTEVSVNQMERTGRLDGWRRGRSVLPVCVPELLAPTSSVTSSVITPPASIVSSSSQPVEKTSRLPFHSHHTSHPLRITTGCCHSMHSSCSARSTRTSVCSLLVRARKRSGVRDIRWTTDSRRTHNSRQVDNAG